MVKFYYFLIQIYKFLSMNNDIYIYLGIGDWGLGIGDWGLGIWTNPQSPFICLKKYN